MRYVASLIPAVAVAMMAVSAIMSAVSRMLQIFNV